MKDRARVKEVVGSVEHFRVVGICVRVGVVGMNRPGDSWTLWIALTGFGHWSISRPVDSRAVVMMASAAPTRIGQPVMRFVS